MTASAPGAASRLSGGGDCRPRDNGSFVRLAEIGEEPAGRQERGLISTRFREIIDPRCEHRNELVHRFAIEKKTDRMIAGKRQPADDLLDGGHEIDLTERSTAS